MAEYFSPTLLQTLLKRRDVQDELLVQYASRLESDISLLCADGSWRSFPRWTDPKSQGNKFNGNNVTVGLSQSVPGLLGLFSLRAASPPNAPPASSGISTSPSPNLGIYSGYLMLNSEWKEYDRLHSHSMGVELKEVKGKSLERSKAVVEGVTLVGHPVCAVVQALHTTKPNCSLTSGRGSSGAELLSKMVGRNGVALPFNALTLQAHKRIAVGEELTIQYSRSWQHKAISCAVCCLSVTADELKSDPPIAFKCKGYIDGSPCPFHTHSKCATMRGVSYHWEYCHFCFVASANDDHVCESDTLPWLEHHLTEQTSSPGGTVSCFVVTNGSFAAALHRAISLSWTIVGAKAIEMVQVPEHVKTVSARSDLTDASRSRVIEYHCQQSSFKFAEEALRFRSMHSHLSASGNSPFRSRLPTSQPVFDGVASPLYSPTPSSSSSANAVAPASAHICSMSVPIRNALGSSEDTIRTDGSRFVSETELLLQQQLEAITQIIQMDDADDSSLLSQKESRLSSLDVLTSQLGEPEDESSEASSCSWPSSGNDSITTQGQRDRLMASLRAKAEAEGAQEQTQEVNTVGDPVVIDPAVDSADQPPASPSRDPSPDISAFDRDSRNKISWWRLRPDRQKNYSLRLVARSACASPASYGRFGLLGPPGPHPPRGGELTKARRCLSSSLASMNLTEPVPSNQAQPPSTVDSAVARSISALNTDAQVAHAHLLAEVDPSSALGRAASDEGKGPDIDDGWMSLSDSEAHDEKSRPAEPAPDDSALSESDSTAVSMSDSDYSPSDQAAQSDSNDVERDRSESETTDSDVPELSASNDRAGPQPRTPLPPSLDRPRDDASSGSTGASNPVAGALAVRRSPPTLRNDEVYDNLQPQSQEQISVQGQLSVAGRRICRQVAIEHRQVDAALAQTELNKPRNLRQLAKGSKRAAKRKEKRLRRLLCDDNHCPREQCNVEKFEQRLQRVSACCFAKHRRRIQNGLISGEDRPLWENRAKRLNCVEENPVEILKAQLSVAWQPISKLREAFFTQYGGNVPRAVSSSNTAAAGDDVDHSENSAEQSADDGEFTDEQRDVPSVIASNATSPSSSSVSPSAAFGQTPLSSSPTGEAPTVSHRGARQLKPKQCAALLELNYAGIPVCLKCYADVHPEVATTTLTEWVLRLGRGRGYDADGPQPLSGEHSARHRTGPAPASKTALAIMAIRNLALRRGDAAPNRNLTVLAERTVEQLTDAVNLWISAEHGGLRVSEALVKKVLRAMDGQIKLAGREHSLPVCDLCSTFHKMPKPSDQERNMQKVHLAIQQSERTAVDINCQKAISSPEDNLTLYMDGMDQAKTALPSLLDQPHWLQGATQWKVHVTGVMAFGPFRTFAYLNYENVHSSAALTVHILSDVLRRVLDGIDEDINEAAAEATAAVGSPPTSSHGPSSLSSSSSPSLSSSSARRRGRHPIRYTRRPKRLYLVMDNSGKDNKNNCVFRFLALLVQRGIFEEIWVNFLIVGHTHDRVDQFFSCISRQLATRDTWTPEQLRDQIRAAYRIGGRSGDDSNVLPVDSGKAATGGSVHSDSRFDGDITLDALCRERPEVVLVEAIADWGTWLGIGDRGGGSVHASRLSTPPATALASSPMQDSPIASSAAARLSSAERGEGKEGDGAPAIELFPDVTVMAAAARRAQGLPCFTGTIGTISLPQVFHFSRSLQLAVELRVKPHSFKLDLARESDAKLRVELREIALQDPVVLISADSPVPCADPYLFPPYPFPAAALQSTFDTMVAHAKAVFTAPLQQQWITEMERMKTIIAEQGKACSECVRIMAAIASIKLASDYKKQGMTDDQRRDERNKARRRSELQRELQTHMRDSATHAPATGLWTKMWAPCDPQLLDPVQLLIPGRVSAERADQDHDLRRKNREEATTGYVKNLHKFIKASTLNTSDYNRFELGLTDYSYRPLVSIHASKAAKLAAQLHAEVPFFQQTEGQNRSIPIEIGDLVAIHVDNFQWPEYPVSVALVVNVQHPKKRKRAGVKSRGKEATASDSAVAQRGKRKKGMNAAPDNDAKGDDDAGVEPDWGDENGKTQLTVQFYYLRFPSYKAAKHLLDAKVERYKTAGVPRIALGCLQRALRRFKMEQQRTLPNAVQRLETTMQLDDQSALGDSEGGNNRGRHEWDGKEAAMESAQDSDSDEDMSDWTHEESDGEYEPEGKRRDFSLRRLRRQREGEAEWVRRHLDEALREPTRRVPDPSSATSHPTSSSSASSSSLPPGTPMTSPAPTLTATVPPGIRPSSDRVEDDQAVRSNRREDVLRFPVHEPLSSHYTWASGAHHQPGTWWRVFTEMNDMFAAAKPSADVLRQLPPFLGVAELESQQLGMVLLPSGQRVTQFVLQEEVLCWEQCNLALTREGYFTEEFAIKLHHCLEWHHQAHGGYYGNDDITDDERESDDGADAKEDNAIAQDSVASRAAPPARSSGALQAAHQHRGDGGGAAVNAVVVDTAATIAHRAAARALRGQAVRAAMKAPSLFGPAPLSSIGAQAAHSQRRLDNTDSGGKEERGT